MSRNFNKSPISAAEIAKDMVRVAEGLEISLDKLSLNLYVTNNGQFGETTIRRKGGWSKIKNTLVPDQEKDLGTIVALKQQASYTSKLENLVGSKLNVEEMVRDVISKLNVKISSQKKASASKSKEKVEVVAMLNDLHYGLRVDSEENGGLNNYDFKEAGRRTAMFIKEIGDYKLHKRDQVSKLNLIINGDILEGILRSGQGNDQHLLTHQINGALHILTHSIQYLSKEFKEIELHCIAGNHDRMVHKDLGKRPTSEVFDSYANIVYYALSTIFKSNKSITFTMPKTPYGFINLPGGRLMYLHGDGILNRQLGNVGKSINVASVNSAIREFNSGEVSKGNKPVTMVLVGHTHGYAHWISPDGVEFCVAPSLCGPNGYAHMLNINHNLIAQIIFESTKDFVFGDSRLVRVNAADKDSSLDSIIPVYNKDLKA